MLKDTLKLSFVNSTNIWKLILYRFLCLLCVLGLTTVIAWPIINALIKNNFFVNLQSSFENMLFTLNFEKLFASIDSVFKDFWSIIVTNGLVVQTILCAVFVIILVSFLEQYAKVALNQCIYGYMSSLTKYGFTNSYISNFGKATVLGTLKLVTLLPINILIWLGAYLFASSLYAKIGVFAIILVFFLLTIIVSLKNTFFAGWVPASIVHGESAFKSLTMGFSAVFRNFFKTYSSFLMLTLAVFVVNVVTFSFTAGVGLIVTIPLTTLLFVIMGETMYFQSLGMRYYVDGEHIITPKKFEERDSFEKVKDII